MISRRPLGITVTGISSSIVGVLEFIVGLGFLPYAIITGYAAWPSFYFFGWANLLFAIQLLALGVIDLVLGHGFLEGSKWAWTIAVYANILFIPLLLVLVLAGIDQFVLSLTLLKEALLVLYLITPRVRHFFVRDYPLIPSPEYFEDLNYDPE